MQLWSPLRRIPSNILIIPAKGALTLAPYQTHRRSKAEAKRCARSSPSAGRVEGWRLHPKGPKYLNMGHVALVRSVSISGSTYPYYGNLIYITIIQKPSYLP